MKLRRVEIHNFRGLVELDVVLDDYSLLVGPNNVGKSTVIDAIRAFYEKDGFKFKKAHDMPKHFKCDESWVELTFELTAEEHDSLADDYKVQNRQLRLRKYFISPHKLKAGVIYGYKNGNELSEDQFYGARDVQHGKLGDIVYIPAMSSVDEHTKLSGPSALRDLLTNIMEKVVRDGRAFDDFHKNFQQFSKEIYQESTEDQRSLEGLESKLNKMLIPWKSEFRLNFRPPSAAETIKSLLDWDLVDKFHGQEQGIEYFGSGFQRHFIFSLIQLGSDYAGERPSGRSKDFSPSLKLLLFEEPEAFLHPPQQEVLARSLMRLASSDDSWQVICATHSSNFVSRSTRSFPSIVRLRNSPSTGAFEAYQIDTAQWDNIVDDNQQINAIVSNTNPDDSEPEMESVKYFLWLNPHRANLFFANHVLLVEGPTEVALINRLVDDGMIQEAEGGFYVVDCIGKHNVHRFMKLLSALGISHSVIHDDDGNQDQHRNINQLIHDSVDSTFTHCVEPISGSTESMLGIPEGKPKHRKPQNVLYHYESGQIDQSKITDFCALVESCLPLS
ncbi:MAG: AAA family ATPase [Caldilineaceae bacterium]|nr:AAA family ATPase [Caldilineaceae bacterium]